MVPGPFSCPLYRHRVQCRSCLRFTVSGLLLPPSILSVPRACAEVHEILPSCSIASLYVNLAHQINRAFCLSNSQLFLFYHKASPFPFLKHCSRARTPFRAPSFPLIMSASLRIAVEGNTRPPRLQPSPSLPNLRCVQMYHRMYSGLSYYRTHVIQHAQYFFRPSLDASTANHS